MGQNFEASELPCPRSRFVREFDSVPLRCLLRGRFGGCTHVGFELGGHACRSEFLYYLCLLVFMFMFVSGGGIGDLGFAVVLDFGVWGP